MKRCNNSSCKNYGKEIECLCNHEPKEICVSCGVLTDVSKSTHIDQRVGYVEVAGQLCGECYLKQ